MPYGRTVVFANQRTNKAHENFRIILHADRAPLMAVLERLQSLYYAFENTHSWIGRVGENVQQSGDSPDLDHVMSYDRVRNKFNSEFRDLCAKAGYGSLEHLLKSEESQRPEMERSVEFVLLQRSESESQFLLLLGEQAISYNEPGTDLLPQSVYHAGEELARNGVFVRRDLPDTQVFIVPLDVVRIVKRTLFPDSPMRMEVRLRLDRVASRADRGSGQR